MAFIFRFVFGAVWSCFEYAHDNGLLPKMLEIIVYLSIQGIICGTLVVKSLRSKGRRRDEVMEFLPAYKTHQDYRAEESSPPSFEESLRGFTSYEALL